MLEPKVELFTIVDNVIYYDNYPIRFYGMEGRRIKRGPGWVFGKQGKGYDGVITREHPRLDGWVRVEWNDPDHYEDCYPILNYSDMHEPLSIVPFFLVADDFLNPDDYYLLTNTTAPYETEIVYNEN